MDESLNETLAAIERNTMLAAVSVKRVLTLEEAALFTGLSKSRVYFLTSTKQIPHYKPSGKMVYFDREELEEWLRRVRVTTIDEAAEEAAAYAALNPMPMKGGARL